MQTPFTEGLSLENIYAMLGLPSGAKLYLKIEGFNVAGSIKLKPALKIVRALVKSGRLRPGGTLIESSSGNFGVALSIVARMLGYRFICVIDPNCTPAARKLMEDHGAQVICVNQRDAQGGFLGTRLALINEMLKADPEGLLWINQYSNADNWRSHYETTAQEILQAFPEGVNYLFVGAGTCGTAMGVLRYFAKYSPDTQIIVVDAFGSTTFGGLPGRRVIPGIGTTVKPPILNVDEVPAVAYAKEWDAVRSCHALARGGLYVGGSTGSVLSVVEQWAWRFTPTDVVVAISPDLGAKYLDTIYNSEWCAKEFPGLIPPGVPPLPPIQRKPVAGDARHAANIKPGI